MHKITRPPPPDTVIPRCYRGPSLQLNGNLTAREPPCYSKVPFLLQAPLLHQEPLGASGTSSSKMPLTARGPLTAKRCLLASMSPCCFILQDLFQYQGPLLLQGLIAVLRPPCCFRAAKLTASGPLKMLLQGWQATAGAPSTSGVPYWLRPLNFSSFFLPSPFSLSLFSFLALWPQSV